MAGFASVIDQQRPVRILTSFLREKTYPHALLFTGIEGVGKGNAAEIFARACNCKSAAKTDNGGSSEIPLNLPCDRCRSCRKIESGNHPDIIRIKPAGQFIRIDQIRALGDTLNLKPYEAKLRVVIIRHAHTMNPSASNALLKMLEEPPARTILILTALQTTDLLPTIVSRCQHIRFNPISRSTLARFLNSEHGVAPERAEVLAAMANGSLTRAVKMAGSDWLRQRKWLIEASGLDQPGMLASRQRPELLAFAEILARDRKDLPLRLEVLKFWLRDLLIFPHDPSRIINVDLKEHISGAAGQLPQSTLEEGYHAIQSAEKNLQSNANVRLTLEDMMFKLAGLYNTQIVSH